MTRPGYYEDNRVLFQCQRQDCRGFGRSSTLTTECEGTLDRPHAPKRMQVVEDGGRQPTTDLVVNGSVERDGAFEPVEYRHDLGCFVTPGWVR